MFTYKIFWNNYTHLELYITKIILFIAFFHLFLTKFIYYLFSAALSPLLLFSSCDEQGLLTVVVSLVAEHGVWSTWASVD